MPYCRKCGANLKEDARFCNVCGTQVVAIISKSSTYTDAPLFQPQVSIEKDNLLVSKNRRLVLISILTVAANFLVFAINGNSMLLPLRWIVSLLFSLILPGYCLLGVLFPKKELEIEETICLSVISSFGMLAICGLLVNSLLGNIDLIPLMLLLSVVVFVLTVISVPRYQEQTVIEEKISAK